MSFLAAAAPLIGGLAGNFFGGDRGRQIGGLAGGAIASAAGRSGQQGSVTDRGTVGGTSEVTQQELPELGEFRRGLIDLFGGEFARAQRPVFGQEQQANFLNQVNDVTAAATDSIRQSLAATGGLNSGALASEIGQTERGRAGQLSNFFANLPFQESQARFARTTPLLTTGLQFVGRGPLSQISTSQQTTDSTRTSTGPSFGRALAGEAGRLAALPFLDRQAGGIFGPERAPLELFGNRDTNIPSNPTLQPVGTPPFLPPRDVAFADPLLSGFNRGF